MAKEYHYHYHIYNSPGSSDVSRPEDLPVEIITGPAGNPPVYPAAGNPPVYHPTYPAAGNPAVYPAAGNLPVYPPLYPAAGRELGKTVTGKRPLTLKGAIRQNANIVCGVFLIAIFIEYASAIFPGIVYEFFFSANQYVQFRHMLEQAANIFSYSIASTVALFLMKSWLKIPARAAFPMRWKGFSVTIPAVFVCLGVMMVGSYASGFIATALEGLFGVAPAPADFPLPVGAPATVLYVISVVLLPSVLEELIFRGAVLQSLRRYGDGFALVASSALFALMHSNWLSFIPTFLFGLAIGFFVMRTGSILTGILIHMANNGLYVINNMLTNGGGEELSFLVNAAASVLYLTSGVIGALYLLMRRPGMFRLAQPPPGVTLGKGKKHLIFFTSVASVVFIVMCFGLAALSEMASA